MLLREFVNVASRTLEISQISFFVKVKYDALLCINAERDRADSQRCKLVRYALHALVLLQKLRRYLVRSHVMYPNDFVLEVIRAISG